MILKYKWKLGHVVQHLSWGWQPRKKSASSFPKVIRSGKKLPFFSAQGRQQPSRHAAFGDPRWHTESVQQQVAKEMLYSYAVKICYFTCSCSPKGSPTFAWAIRNTQISATQCFWSQHASGLQPVHTFSRHIVFCVPCDPPSLLKEGIKQKGRVDWLLSLYLN